MSNPITNPLQSLLSRAAASLPKETGLTSKLADRLRRGGTLSVILCDCSASMAESAWGGKTKIEILREAVAECWRGERIVCFGGTEYSGEAPTPQEIWANPEGGTPLDKALAHLSYSGPGHTLVISDGKPDDTDAALIAADRLGGVINVLYVGPDDDKEAIAFMHRLASTGAGRVVVNDVRRAYAGRPTLGSSMRGLLPAPQGVRP